MRKAVGVALALVAAWLLREMAIAAGVRAVNVGLVMIIGLCLVLGALHKIMTGSESGEKDEAPVGRSEVREIADSAVVSIWVIVAILQLTVLVAAFCGSPQLRGIGNG